MARPLRIDVPGGWYHVTARGQRRERIYYDARDRKEFLARVEEMTKRFLVEVHAYALMPNHYHLLIRSPKANTSPAMQWLNTGYGMWWNRRHGQVGHVFQGRFKSILVEGGATLLTVSQYLHFNPVAVKGLGWAKREKAAEALGWQKSSPQQARKRLETLRSYRWSSYRAYAGYEPAPCWLSRSVILGRVEGGCEGYRQRTEKRLRQGESEDIWAGLKGSAILGGERFTSSMRAKAVVLRETQGRKALRREVTWEQVITAVETVKGERWDQFMDRHGDWGRDLALWIARRRGGMTLRELGEKAGGMDYSAVSEAIRQFDRNHRKSAPEREALKSSLEILNLET
ncbi:MAG TPA: transposase [Kiritimatiellia bacterium]|nr:transposase [Kiritimatiellia bacterium]